jgi:hypothetical protein
MTLVDYTSMLKLPKPRKRVRLFFPIHPRIRDRIARLHEYALPAAPSCTRPVSVCQALSRVGAQVILQSQQLAAAAASHESKLLPR